MRGVKPLAHRKHVSDMTGCFFSKKSIGPKPRVQCVLWVLLDFPVDPVISHVGYQP